ncbi:hypothetical protein DFS34DRAFT_652718 [Phlyctochytrium arcticum]|nr:hypothetical protein DFS34DRAFT_652718 [Phlyctochytrium arcticum]
MPIDLSDFGSGSALAVTLFGPALDRVFGCTAKEFHTRFKARTQNDYVVVEPFGKCAARLAQAFDRLLVGAYLQIAVSEKFIVHDSGDASNAESPRNHQEDGPEQRVDDLTDLIAALNIEAQGGQKGRATHLSGSERRRLRWKLKPDAAISVMEVVGGVPSTIMEELGWEEVKRRTTRKTAIKASPLDDETFESAPGLCLPSRPVENHHDDSASHTSEDLSDWPEELQDVVCDPTVTRCAFVLEEIPWNVLEAEINKQAIEERDEERRSQHVTKPVQNDLQPLPPVSLKSPMLLGLLALAEQGTSQRTPLQSTDTFSTPRDESPQVETQSQMHEISALLQGLDLDDLDDGGYYFTQQQVQASGVNKTVQPADDDEEDDDLIRVLARVCLEDEDDDF